MRSSAICLGPQLARYLHEQLEAAMKGSSAVRVVAVVCTGLYAGIIERAFYMGFLQII